MVPALFYILLSLNIILYFLCFFFIIKHKSYSSISIRSPSLLIANNFAGLIMTSTIISYYYYIGTNENNEKNFYHIPFCFYLAEYMMIMSFILRYKRIDMCSKIYESEQIDKNEFNKRRYLYGEKFYVKILLIAFTIFLIIMILIWVISKKYEYTIPDFLYYDLSDNSGKQFRLIYYICFHFVILSMLIKLCFNIFNRETQQKTDFELISYTICIFILFNSTTGFDIYLKDISHSKQYKLCTLIVSLACLYFCLFINGYMPIILSYFPKTNIGYHFNPQLMNNLYLFLSNEECYLCFTEYIKEEEIYSFYLKVYTHIMTFKLQFLNEDSIQNLYEEAKEIYINYFTEPNIKRFDESVKEKMNEIQIDTLAEDSINNEMFDSALKYVFEQLSKKFLTFKNTTLFESLEKSMAIQSYIQCKMSNTGLINKY